MNRSILSKAVIISLLFSLHTFDLLSQNRDDALRYSQLINGGSARVMGAGGAFGSMGGDFGVTSLNVAGLADYKSKEVMFTLSYNQASTETRNDDVVIGENTDGREVIIENLAFVKHSKPFSAENLIASNFAIGLQQYTNYNQVFSWETDTPGSIADYFTELTNEFCPCEFDIDFSQDFPFQEDLSTATGAIFYDELFQRYIPDYADEFITPTGGQTEIPVIRKRQSVDRSGALNELVLAWAGKYKSSLSIGLGIGVPYISYSQDKFYSEIDANDELRFNQLNYDETLTASGIGWNLKLGVGYTLAKRIRLGFGFQSPSWFRINELFYYSLFYDSDNYSDEPSPLISPEGRFTYKLRTPMRMTLSGGYIMVFDKLKGFVNVDVQRVDYRSNRFDFTFNNDDPGEVAYQVATNADIENELRATYNFNIGGELAYSKFRVRAGVSLLGRPFFDEQNKFDKVYAAGFGYRRNKIFLDLAYQFRKLSEGYSPYSVGGNQALQSGIVDTKVNKLALTIGFKI